jgi:hypothetical protein
LASEGFKLEENCFFRVIIGSHVIWPSQPC